MKADPGSQEAAASSTSCTGIDGSPATEVSPGTEQTCIQQQLVMSPQRAREELCCPVSTLTVLKIQVLHDSQHLSCQNYIPEGYNISVQP